MKRHKFLTLQTMPGPVPGVEDREETIKNYQEEKKPCQSKSRMSM
jgi:hypothetical protein